MAFPIYRTAVRPALDGRLHGPPWDTAPKSDPFVDMATAGPAPLETRVAALWDDAALYIGFWVEEPYPVARLTERDSLIFQENDVEVFLDGGDAYYEFEVNARGTVYEVFFVWRDAYRRAGFAERPEYDVHAREAYSFGGDYDRQPESFWRGTHPRGTRWAFLDWDFPGMRCAVHVDGALNEPTVRSLGWTVELAFPWEGMRDLANGRALPPRDGDEWRMFFGRFQKLAIGPKEVQAAWCLTPHGVYDTHQPEKFTPVVFRDRPA